MSAIDATCPQCGAQYKLTQEQLSVAQGQVRCGACMHVFQAIPSATPQVSPVDDSRSEFVDDKSDDDILIQDEPNELDSFSIDLKGINRSGESNFFDDFEEVDVISQKETQGHVDESWAEDLIDEVESMPDPKPRQAAKDNAENIDDFANEIKLKPNNLNDLGFDEADKAGLLNRITPEPVELKVVKDHSAAINLMLSLLLVGFVISAVAQFLYFTADTLGRNPELRKTYSVFCELSGCVLPEQFSIKDISASSTHQNPHAVYEGALVFETVITNHAKFRQPFPNIELYFKNLKDEVIAARKFSPSEYLRGEIATSKTMPIRQAIHLALEINDPGSQATGYELKLSYD